ncbi:hypothetical protein GG344DRAFT_28059, partial [Lentinula edodes]
MTPWEAATGKKPDLGGVREWGEKVWVRLEKPKGTKLGGRVKEGRWIGMDDSSKGFRIYWPDTRSVGVEQNVYHRKESAVADRLEGEDWEFIEDDTTTPTPSTTTSVSKPTPIVAPVPTELDSATVPDVPPPIPTATVEISAKRTRKPSARILDIIAGNAVASTRPSDPVIPKGIRLPPTV